LPRLHPHAGARRGVAVRPRERRDARLHRPRLRNVSALLKLGAQAVAVAAVAALAAVLVWRLTHQTPPPKVGGPAPNFSLRRLDGDGTVSLRSLRGKTVVPNFCASWCDPCKREAPALEKVWNEYRSRGLVVLGVDSGDVRSDARR